MLRYVLKVVLFPYFAVCLEDIKRLLHSAKTFSSLKLFFVLFSNQNLFSNLLLSIVELYFGGYLFLHEFIIKIIDLPTYLQANVQEGLEGNPVAGTMKNFSRILAVLTVPFTMSFPKVRFLLTLLFQDSVLFHDLVPTPPFTANSVLSYVLIVKGWKSWCMLYGCSSAHFIFCIYILPPLYGSDT